MITATCVEKLRDKNGNIKGYILQDNNGVQMKFSSEQVKQAIFLQQLTVDNLKLTSDGRLIDNKKQDNNAEITNSNTLEKIGNLKCYEIKTLGADNIANIISKLVNKKVIKVPIVSDYGYTLYCIENLPLSICCLSCKFDDKKDKKCTEFNEVDTVTELADNCKGRQCVMCIAQPKNTQIDWINAIYNENGEHEVNINNGKDLINVARVFKVAQKTEISYCDIIYKIYEMILKFVDTKYGTVNNYLEHYVCCDYEDNTEFGSATVQFCINFKEVKKQSGYGYSFPGIYDNELKASILLIRLFVTDDGYEIHMAGGTHRYENKEVFSEIDETYSKEQPTIRITIGFNDDLKKRMQEIKIIADGLFKASLKELKDIREIIKNK